MSKQILNFLWLTVSQHGYLCLCWWTGSRSPDLMALGEEAAAADWEPTSAPEGRRPSHNCPCWDSTRCDRPSDLQTQREKGKEREGPWIGKRVTQSNISIKQRFGIHLYDLCKHWRQGVCTSTHPRLWSTGRTAPHWQTAAQTVWWTDSSTDRCLDLQSPLCPTLTETERDTKRFNKTESLQTHFCPSEAIMFTTRQQVKSSQICDFT